MNRNNVLKVILLVFYLLFIVQLVHAGILADINMWANEKANIFRHSRIIKREVKNLYHERESIQRFAQSVNYLINAYKGISNKRAKSSIPLLLEIAHAITVVVQEYQNLAPKAEAMYKRVQPSLKYLATLDESKITIETGFGYIDIKGLTISDKRLNKLARANGWNRVFSSIKENPLNLFRWGRLIDEYKLGKIEAQYPLKCAQIAFEATAYYKAIKHSIAELIGIKNEIDGILGGNLGAILNIGGTINNISKAGNSILPLGVLLEKGTATISKRFNELLDIQEKYVHTLQQYKHKYNKHDQWIYTNTYSASAPKHSHTTSMVTSGLNSSGGNISLQKAMQLYQQAYENYIRISQSGNVSQAELNQAIANLQYAKKLVEQSKAQAKAQ